MEHVGGQLAGLVTAFHGGGVGVRASTERDDRSNGFGCGRFVAPIIDCDIGAGAG